MSQQCAVCGAILPEGDTCQALFEKLLSLEYTDPAYGQVHFLTVACFMIQHEQYSDEALVWIRSVLQTYLQNPLTSQQFRRIVAQGMDGTERSWKVVRQEVAPALPKVSWSMTIADVASHLTDAETYCEYVRRWAETTVRQMGAVYR